MPPITGFVATVPVFLAYFTESLALLAVFLVIYTKTTPLDEFALIRTGNRAAALSLSGSMIGFVLPLASVISHSGGLTDVLLWGAVALVVQLGVFLVIRLLIPTLPGDIVAGNGAVAGLVAAISVGVGVLNAACMVP